MTRNCLVLVALLCLLQCTAAIADKGKAASPGVTLTADERQLLEGLLKQGLFDPTGAERVRVKTSVRTVLGTSKDVVREGWLRKTTANAPATIVFIDGEERSVPDRRAVKSVDFIATCRSRFPEFREAPATEGGVHHGTLRNRPLPKEVEEFDKSPLAAAAWLHRLSHDDLAVRALSEARSEAALGRRPVKGVRNQVDDDWIVTQFCNDCARIAFEEMVHAFIVGADDEALAAGERLVRLFPDAAAQFRQSKDILADLRRRKKAGTFGQTRRQQWPAGYKTWDVGKQTAFLIESLDQIDGRQLGEARFVSLVDDPSVQTLIRIGDPAVPALIGVIENDSRLTRGGRYRRHFSENRTVLSVREAALDALMSITGLIFYDANVTGNCFTQRGEAEARRMAQRLKIYWGRYGRLPFDERMVRILTEPTSDFVSKRQAASNLAHLGESRVVSYSQIRYDSSLSGTHRAPIAPVKNAAVKKFKDPTIASAILAAFDADLNHFDSQPHQDYGDFLRRAIEDTYIQALIDLGDTAIASELTHRSFSAWQLRERQLFANAASQLGAPGAMRAFAKQIERAGFALPADKPDTSGEDQPGVVALRGIVEDLARTKTPEADRALFAISDPRHPYFETARSRIRAASELRYGQDCAWFCHPFCLNILRQELDNQEPTGGHYRREGTRSTLTNKKEGHSSDNDLPPPFSDPKLLKDSADERRCDRAAHNLANLVYGLPAYHPLAKDADARLKELRRVFDSLRNRYRLATLLETQFLELFNDDYCFVPDWPPLTRPASEDDVKAGRALFQLNGKGQLAPLHLPAVASLSRPLRAESFPQRPKLLMIVQAEIDADGKTIYGVIGDGAARKARPDELTDIKPIRKSFFDFLR